MKLKFKPVNVVVVVAILVLLVSLLVPLVDAHYRAKNIEKETGKKVTVWQVLKSKPNQPAPQDPLGK